MAYCDKLMGKFRPLEVIVMAPKKDMSKRPSISERTIRRLKRNLLIDFIDKVGVASPDSEWPHECSGDNRTPLNHKRKSKSDDKKSKKRKTIIYKYSYKEYIYIETNGKVTVNICI